MVHHLRSQSHGRDRGLKKLVPSLLAFRHDDNIRLRLNKAIETTDSEEFVDIAYKLGLFLTEGEDD